MVLEKLSLVSCGKTNEVNVPSRKTSILVVDDDIRILRMVQRILEMEGYRVLTARDGKAALETFYGEEFPNLVLLDIMMPGMDGYTVCHHIREFSKVPIIMVTAKSSEEEKVEGLDFGADDYISKPFSAKELAARVRAVLRRTQQWEEHPEPTFRLNDLIIDFAMRKVTLGDHEVDLTTTEYKLISYLARKAGMIITPDEILEKVWGEGYLGENNILQVNLARLRKKLKDNPKDPRYIETKHGMGYTIKKSPNRY